MEDERKDRQFLLDEIESLREQLAERQALLDAVMEHVADGFIIADAPEACIRLVSAGCCRLSGLSRDALVGLSAEDRSHALRYYSPDGARRLCAEELPLSRAVRHGESVKRMEMLYVRPDGERSRIVCDACPVRDGEGRIAFGVASWRDVTAERAAQETLERALVEKEFLIREVHHRVKNNLQVIFSLLSLQASQLQDTTAIQAIRDSQTRVRSMALIHEKLHQTGLSSRIDFSAYVLDLFDAIREAYGLCRAPIRFEADVESIGLGLDQAVACGLIFNELITNAFKHAFPEGRQGVIRVSARREGKLARMAVGDDGAGMPVNVDSRRARSLGMTLIGALVDQLGGELTFSSGAGTRFEFAFPLAPSAE